MSTYTDLHNRVKENIAVDYNNRITPQRVRLFNEQNEFWGTLRGHVSAEGIFVDGGYLSGVTLKDTVLEGEVILPSGTDLVELDHRVTLISVDCIEVAERLYREEDARASSDLVLSIKIDNIHDDFVREMKILSIELTDQINQVSTYLSSNINYLSDEIDTTNFNLNREIYDRVLADKQLCNFINDVHLSSIQRDTDLSNALSAHEKKNDEQFAYADEKMLSTVEHDRHYVINNSKTTNYYPYIVKDYAVNVYRANVPDARVTYTNIGGKTTEIGRIQLDSDTSDKLPFTFTPYQNIDDVAIASALVGNMPYSFTEEQKVVPTSANGYSLKYTIQSVEGAQLSDAKLTLVPTLPEYHKVYLSGTTLMIGKFYDTKPAGACSDISSGVLFVDTNDLSLLTFNKFKHIHFDNLDDKTTKLETERVTYLSNNEFRFEKNIDSAKYIQLTDVSNDSHDAFARIYDFKNGISGIISDDAGNITDINVEIDLPIPAIAYLNNTNNFTTVIESTELQDTIVSAKVFENASADFDVVYKSEQYSYAFTRPNDRGEIIEIGTVIPLVYNKTLRDTPDYKFVDVDASKITHIVEFAKTWRLPKVEDNLWMIEVPGENGSVLNIKYNEINLFVKVVDGTTQEITRRKYDVKVDSPVISNPDDCHHLRYCSGTVDLNQKRIDVELPEVTYYAIAEAASSTDEFDEYVLDIDTANNDVVKFIFPEKTTPDISREFFMTVKLDSKIKKAVKADIRFANGVPVEIFNNKHKDLYIKSSSDPKEWVTYMVNEVQPDKFLITDLNDYEDHLIIAQLRQDLNELSGKHHWLSDALCAEIQDLSASLSNVIELSVGNLQDQILSNDADIDYLSDQVDFLLSVDRETMNYKGTLPYLPNLSDEDGHDLGYNFLSTFVLLNLGTSIEGHIKKGDFFRLSAVQPRLLDGNVPHKDVWFGAKDYFVFNKDCIAETAKSEDLDIFRNAQSETEWLSAALCAEIDNLSALLCGEVALSVKNLLDQILSNDADIKFLSDHIDTLSTNLCIEILNLSTSLSDTTRLSIEELQRQVISNDADIDYLSDQVDFLLSVDKDSMVYHSTLPYCPNDVDPRGTTQFGCWLSSFLLGDEKVKELNRVKFGDFFRLSASQSCIYDTDVISNYLGEKDLFIINKNSDLTSIRWSDVDIIRNSETEFKWLSTNLCIEILNLSTLLSDTTRLSIENLQDQIISNDNDIEFLSTDIKRLCVEISGNIETVSTSLSIEISSLSTSLSTDIDNLSTSLSDTTRLSIENLQDQIISNDNDITYLSHNISCEVERNRNHVAYFGDVKLSTEYLDPETGAITLNHLYGLLLTNLSIQQFGRDSKLNTGFLFHSTGNVLSIYDTTDTVEIKKLHDNDFILINKNVEQLSDIRFTDVEIIKDYDLSSNLLQDQIINNDNDIEFLSGHIDDLSTSLCGVIDLSVKNLQDQIISNDNDIEFLSTDIKRLCVEISGNIETVSTSLSIDVDNLSTSLCGIIELSAGKLQKQITENDHDITYISSEVVSNDNDIANILNYISGDNSLCTELSIVKYHYDRTFEKDYHVDVFGSDVSVDLLKITEEDNTGKQYTLHLSAGTLVLVPVIK